MSAYNSIILCNVSAENLREGFLNNIEAYVKDFGGEFIATGGSRGLSKVDIEKEVAARTLDSFRPNRDEIGVIAFDDTVYKGVPRKKIDDKERKCYTEQGW